MNTTQPASRHNNVEFVSTAHEAPGHETSSSLQIHLAAARPHLLRVIVAWGIALDLAEDVVQETLLAAWQHQDHLHSQDRMDAWLVSIARNCCRMHFRRAQSGHARASAPTGMAYVFGPVIETTDPDDYDPLTAIPDPDALDPLEDLERRDVVIMLHRALGYLSEETRHLVELCYLAELPQRAVAQQLGIPLSTLEARLHRARQHLRQLLSGTLRDEAESVGLLQATAEIATWQSTREWCHWCGRERLQGLLEPQPDGTSRLRLRCQTCMRRFGANWADSGPTPYLARYRSFGPAIKRFHATSSAYYKHAIEGGTTCPTCGSRVQVSPSQASTCTPNPEHLSQVVAVLECPQCGTSSASAAAITSLADPQIAAFQRAHPRWAIEPDKAASFEGRPAYRHRITDPTSTAQVTFFTDATTLRLLTSIFA